MNPESGEQEQHDEDRNSTKRQRTGKGRSKGTGKSKSKDAEIKAAMEDMTPKAKAKAQLLLGRTQWKREAKKAWLDIVKDVEEIDKTDNTIQANVSSIGLV